MISAGNIPFSHCVAWTCFIWSKLHFSTILRNSQNSYITNKFRKFLWSVKPFLLCKVFDFLRNIVIHLQDDFLCWAPEITLKTIESASRVLGQFWSILCYILYPLYRIWSSAVLLSWASCKSNVPSQRSSNKFWPQLGKEIKLNPHVIQIDNLMTTMLLKYTLTPLLTSSFVNSSRTEWS